MRLSLLLISIVLLSTVTACDIGRKSAKGFRLPDGDVAQGKATFVKLQCYACHTVAGVETPRPEQEREVTIALGGDVPRIQTYGELVTSIINPSHRLPRIYPPQAVTEDGQSKMKNFNDVMTVTELTNLVAFLQSHYKIVVDTSRYYAY